MTSYDVFKGRCYRDGGVILIAGKSNTGKTTLAKRVLNDICRPSDDVHAYNSTTMVKEWPEQQPYSEYKRGTRENECRESRRWIVFENLTIDNSTVRESDVYDLVRYHRARNESVVLIFQSPMHLSQRIRYHIDFTFATDADTEYTLRQDRYMAKTLTCHKHL